MPRIIHPFYLPGNQYVILTRLIRYGSELTGSEHKVLFFIWDRTMGFGKRIESIPYTHFTDGVVGTDGRRHTFGIGIGEQALKKALRGLIAKDLITRTRHDNTWFGSWYQINTRWERPGIEPMWTPRYFEPTGLPPG